MQEKTHIKSTKARTLILGAAALAVLSLNTAVNSVKAEPLAQKLNAYQAFAADFSQSVTDRNGVELSSSTGRLALRRPQQLMLHTITPDEIYLYTLGDGVYYFDAFVNQLSILPLSALTSSPFALLLGENNPAWQDYEITEFKEGRSYRLVPRQGTAAASGPSALVRAVLFFDGKMLTRADVYFADGNCSRYELQDAAFEAADADFVCTVPPDAEIVDER